MNIIKTEAGLYLVGGVAAVLLILYAKHKATAAVENALPYINPASDKNIVNQGVSWVGALISGQPNWTLGGSIYDATHDGALDVTSSNNVIYSGVSGIGSAFTGNENWNLGSAIYDWTH